MRVREWRHVCRLCVRVRMGVVACVGTRMSKNVCGDNRTIYEQNIRNKNLLSWKLHDCWSGMLVHME